MLTGKAYPTLPNDGNGDLQGWIDLTQLKAVIKPLIMDEVKVLEMPYPVKAGALMGYPGIYQTLSADEHAIDSPLLVHLEVFTPEDMPAFISRTQARAAQQKEDKKALLKVNRDAVLHQVPAADNDIATDMQVVKIGQSKAQGKWLEVNKQRIGVVDKKYLSHYHTISKKPFKGEYTVGAAHKSSVALVLNVDLAEIPDKVFFYGECLNSVGERVKTVSPGATHPLREIHFTPENDAASYWVEVTKLDANGKKVEPFQKIPAWSQYPLHMDNKQAGAVYFEQIVAKSDIGQTEDWAIDTESTFWWQLKTGKKDSVIGTDSFGEVEGWVRDCTPGVTRHHPWEWPLFQTLQETAAPAQELERNQRLRLDPADRTELMKALYKILGGTTRQVADTEEQEDVDLLKTENLKTALRYPWLSQQFSHLIVNYESEWFADRGLSKWHELDKMLKKYLCPPQGETETAEAYEKRLEIELAPWQAEKEQRIKKLLWWDKVAGQHGFPVDAKVWHMHPAGMVECFKSRCPVITINDEPITLEFLSFYNGEEIDDTDYNNAASQLGCEVNAIKAVAKAETGITGSFYQFDDDDIVPAILYERHVFYRNITSSKKEMDNLVTDYHELINSKRYPAGGYGAYRNQYKKLMWAYKHDPVAALKAPSWGKFQILGENHGMCGYNTVEAFVADMSLSEKNHLKAFVNFIKSNSKAAKAIVSKDWTAFAEAYNGAGQSGYDVAMEKYYNDLK